MVSGGYDFTKSSHERVPIDSEMEVLEQNRNTRPPASEAKRKKKV